MIIVFSEKSKDDLIRLADFLNHVPVSKEKATNTILNAIAQLEHFPEIGRVSVHRENCRELIVPFGKSAYIVLYTIDTDKEIILITALKHSKEESF